MKRSRMMNNSMMNYSLKLSCVLAVALSITGCTGTSLEKVSWNELSAGLVPTPPDKTTTDAKLSRYRGQTEFLSPTYSMRYMDGGPEAGKAESATEGGSREIQESDVYKIGKPGSKNLFLLNHYRGLQVVDFSAGAEAPKLAGRVPATGGYSNDLYSVAAGDALLSIEQRYVDNKYVSSLVLFDIKDAANPKTAQTVELQGVVRDSRLVGDVLYVAAVRTTNNNSYSYSNEQTSTAYVASYKVSANTVTLIESKDLSLKLGYEQNMNIQEVNEAGQKKYYLLAVTQEQEWSWWNRQSSVEVIDITDPTGAIKTVFTVSAKGSVRERSQTVIKDRTLIVTSNFMNKSNVAMIAVETFLLPEADSEYLTTLERDYRKIAIEREIANAPTGTDIDALKETLLNDAKLGLRGRFVKSAFGPVKLFADSTVTAADTTGLSASLQDVRVSGDLLYAFWVPVNLIDPLDVFDISSPRSGVKHISRLQFDGWISRSFPLEYQGRKFILGLGFVTPAIDNEEGRQYPQAMLFEITQANGKLAAIQVAQTNLSTDAVWTYANFNQPDKMVELRMDSAGVGEVLFTLYQSKDGSFEQGGKIIKFDLEAAIKGTAVFTEGPFLATGASWLKRMFTNTEIGRINSFSDEELAVFGSDLTSIDSASMKAAAILELARNVRDLIPLQNATLFAQVVDKSKGWWYASGLQSTEIRLTTNPDAESHEVTQTIRLKGRFSSLNKLSEQTLLVATEELSQSAEAKAKGIYHQDLRTVRLVKITVGTNSAATSEVMVEFTTQTSSQGPAPLYFIETNHNQEVEVLELEGGQRLLTTGGKVYSLSTDLKAATELELKCLPKAGDIQVSVVSGKLIIQANEMLEEAQRGLYFRKNHLAFAKLEKNAITCDGFVQVPGVAKSINGKVVILTDFWAESVQTITYKDYNGKDQVEYRPDTENGLTSVVIENGLATLIDQKVGEFYSVIESKGKLFVTETDQQNNYGWYKSAPARNTTIYTIGADTAGYLETERVKSEYAEYANISLLATSSGMLVISTDATSGLGVQRLNGTSLLTAKLRPYGKKVSAERLKSVSTLGWSNTYRYDETSKILTNGAGFYGAEAFIIE